MLNRAGPRGQDSVLSALTACQRQLESELLLARKDTRWCAEDGDQVSETVKVPGHVRGVGAQSPGARPGQRTPPLPLAAVAHRSQGLHRDASSQAVARGGSVLARFVLKFPMHLT